uniref:Uncharacterized protein n=1 Tax=Lotharella globosa TaxID=91324 RepID=A0A7S4DLK5_9EUKA
MRAGMIAFVVGAWMAAASVAVPSARTSTRMSSVVSPSALRRVVACRSRQDEKDEQWRLQQEILARRRDKNANAQYFKDMEDRREKLKKDFYAKKIQYRRGEDPLDQWKEINKGKTYKDEYSDEPGYSLPIPLPSFGLPKFDNGERFDLRLPYVDQGYVAEDSDDAVGRFLGIFGIKRGEQAEEPVQQQKQQQKGNKASPRRGAPKRGSAVSRKQQQDVQEPPQPKPFNPFGRLFGKDE